MSAHQSPNWTLGPYVMQSTLLLIAPALFAASIYMELGRIIILVHAEQYSLVRVKWLTKIFVTGDVLSFLMQASGKDVFSILYLLDTYCYSWIKTRLTPFINTGAGLMVKDASTMGTGRNVIIAGLFVQIVFFCFFLCSALVFQSRILKYPTSQSEAPYIPWRKHMYALHASSLLILIRSVFRVIEYIEGQDGFLMHNEVFLYMFDALLMFLVMVVFIVIHPSEINCLLGKGTLMTQRGGLSLSEFTVGV